MLHCRPALGLAAALTSLIAAAATPGQDNVLVIIADDLGVDNVGVYAEGGDLPPTPNIDALATTGVLFRNCWSSPYCSPTRAGMHTGRYSYRTGVGRPVQPPDVTQLQNVLSTGEVTFPEMLDARQSGYAHAYIGKWHLGDARNGGALAPNAAGWSHFAGIVTGGSDYYTWPRIVNGVTATSTTYTSTQMVDDALSWIGGQQQPWVCWLGFTAPHTPFHAPPGALHTQNLQGLDPDVTPRPFYRAMVEAMDTEIGRMLATLGPSVLANTNVVFIGDNGTQNQVTVPPFVVGHAKGTVYEGGCRVPMIIAGPAVGGAPREEQNLVGTIDLFTTLLELCGVDPAVPYTKIDAVSFGSLLQAGGQPAVRNALYTEMFFESNRNTTGFATARNGRYKLNRVYTAQSSQDELFDLQNDKFEQVDLLQSLPLTPLEAASYAFLSGEIAAARDEGGQLTTFGAPLCRGTNGNPTLVLSGNPVLGDTYNVDLINGSVSGVAFLTVGSSRTSWAGLSLPWPMAQIGTGPDCFLRASIDLSVPVPLSGTGSASVAVPVPASLPTLVSGSIFHFWLVSDPGAPLNPRGLTSSQGAEVIIGL